MLIHLGDYKNVGNDPLSNLYNNTKVVKGEEGQNDKLFVPLKLMRYTDGDMTLSMLSQGIYTDIAESSFCKVVETS